MRNEADVIEACITHLLAQGVDHVLIADNLSGDGTDDILRRLTRNDSRVHVVIDQEPAFHQASKVTHLARLARRSGADWIVPFDGDEFWFAERGTLAESLRGSNANTVRAQVFNAVPVEGDTRIEAGSRLTVESRPQSLEKRAVRAHRWLWLERGNHTVRRTGPVQDGLVVLHLPYRGPDHLRRKHAADALADRLASAAESEALQYRSAHGLGTGDVDDVWARLQSGHPVGLLNWDPAPAGAPERPLEWATWRPRPREDPAAPGSGSH